MCRAPEELEMVSVAGDAEPVDRIGADDDELAVLLTVTWAWQSAPIGASRQ